MADLDPQDLQLGKSLSREPPIGIFKRPSRTGSIPKLQGPFEIEFGLDSDGDLDTNLADMFETEDLMMGEEDDLEIDAIDRDILPFFVF